jgi:hypothetical protein
MKIYRGTNPYTLAENFEGKIIVSQTGTTKSLSFSTELEDAVKYGVEKTLKGAKQRKKIEKRPVVIIAEIPKETTERSYEFLDIKEIKSKKENMNQAFTEGMVQGELRSKFLKTKFVSEILELQNLKNSDSIEELAQNGNHIKIKGDKEKLKRYLKGRLG